MQLQHFYRVAEVKMEDLITGKCVHGGKRLLCEQIVNSGGKRRVVRFAKIAAFGWMRLQLQQFDDLFSCRHILYCTRMIVGVLAFHGDFAEHLEVLRSLKVKCLEVRSTDDLTKVNRLIIPGGESTVMARFLEETGVGDAIKKRVTERSLPIYGTCAGAILLARKATGLNPPKTLRLIDITVERNAYGTQLESFSADLRIKGVKSPLPVAFIRAPVITWVGKDAEVLATHQGKPVLVRQARILAGTFHPEVTGEKRIHEMFLTL